MCKRPAVSSCKAAPEPRGIKRVAVQDFAVGFAVQARQQAGASQQMATTQTAPRSRSEHYDRSAGGRVYGATVVADAAEPLASNGTEPAGAGPANDAGRWAAAGGPAGRRVTLSGLAARRSETRLQSSIWPKFRPWAHFANCRLPRGAPCPTSTYNDAGART